MIPTIFLSSFLLRRFWLGLVLAASLLVCVPFTRAQNSAEVQSPAVRIITDLPSYWLEGVRDNVRPIKMEMVVNYYDRGWNHMWVEVNGEGGYLRCDTKLQIQFGDRVLVEGTVVPSKGISADTAKITVLEHNVKNVPLVVDGQLSDFTRLKARKVSFEATFDRETTSDGDHLAADFIADGYLVHMFNWDPEPKFLGLKQGSRVRITGVYSANYDPLTEAVEIDLWCPNLEDVVSISGPEADPRFENALVPIDNLPRMYSARASMAHVAGIVRSNNPGRGVLISDETGVVRVKTLQTLPLQIGDWIEAVGIPVTGGADWSLRSAIIRRAGPSLVAAKKSAARLAPPTLRMVDQVLSLSSKEAAAGHQVDIIGVILWSHPEADYFYVSDTSGSVRVQLSAKVGAGQNKPRSQVRIVGITRMGAFAPEIDFAKSEQISTALFPEAKELTLEQAMSGLEEGHRVSLRGYVQRVAVEGIWSRLTLSTQTGAFDIVLGRDDRMKNLVGSIVSVRGVCRAISNSRRQLAGIEILALYQDDIRVEQPALIDPFSAPLREISALRQFNRSGSLGYWVRVRGTVTQHVPGRFVMIQDGTEGLMLLSEQKDLLVPGDFIEVTGLPGFENGRAVMRESVYRKLDHRSELAAVAITDTAAFDEELDSCLVKVRGSLINSAVDGENLNLAIQTGRRVFAALLPRSSAKTNFDPIQTGSELDLVGVYELVRDERRKPRSFNIQLRSLADVHVLKNPSWWTPGRAFTVTGLLVSFIAMGLTWVSALRRRVKNQTDQLRTQILKEAKLEADNRAVVANVNDCIFTTDLSGNFT